MRDLLDLKPADLRAFLAAAARRGAWRLSAARELSGGPRVPQLCRRAAGQPRAAAAHPRAEAAADAAAAGLARGRDGARRRCRRGCERAVDRRARPCDPAVALRRRPAGRRGAVADARACCRSGATLRVTGKRSKTRIVPVVPAVREAIEDYVRQCPYPLSGDAPLFVGARGGPLNPDLVRRAVAAARRRLGLPDTLTPHALRHSFATHLLARRRGLAGAAGAARPCEPVVDPDLYGGGRGAPARRLSPRPPPRLSRGTLKVVCRGATG